MLIDQPQACLFEQTAYLPGAGLGAMLHDAVKPQGSDQIEQVEARAGLEHSRHLTQSGSLVLPVME